MAKPATRSEPPPEPPIEALREDFLLWDVANAVYVTELLTPTGRADALAQGTHQDIGDRFLIDGKGQPAPPLTLTVTPDAADWHTVALALAGGSAGQGSVSIYWGDGTAQHRDNSDNGDLEHTYLEAGEFIISVINDYGQQADAVLNLVELPPNRIDNTLPEPEQPASRDRA